MTIAKKIAEKGTERKLEVAKAGANAEISELMEDLEKMVQIIALICTSSEIQGGELRSETIATPSVAKSSIRKFGIRGEPLLICMIG